MLDHSSGEWRVTVMVADDLGCQLRVQLSDKVSQPTIISTIIRVKGDSPSTVHTADSGGVHWVLRSGVQRCRFMMC